MARHDVTVAAKWLIWIVRLTYKQGCKFFAAKNQKIRGPLVA